MRRKSDKTKYAQRMGKGSGAKYKPWIQVGEFGSRGTAARVVDWKTGRVVHLLSQNEIYAWYILRWQDGVTDINEQYPLDLEETKKLCEEYGIKHPSYRGSPAVMTTDLLVFTTKGKMAFSVKPNNQLSERSIEKLFIEQKYWESKKIPWRLITAEDIDFTYAYNIRDVVTFYNATVFPDTISRLKYLIAHKKVKVDLTKNINWHELCAQFTGGLSCQQSASQSATSSSKMASDSE